MPFATQWIGETHFAKNPAAAYGIVLMMCAIAYIILENLILKSEGEDSKLKEAIHYKFKEYFSIASYTLGLATSFFYPYLAIGFYYLVALVWLIPDKRIEKLLNKTNMETHEYTNGEITVIWQPKKCIHAAICVKSLPQVYNPKEKPWLKPEKRNISGIKEPDRSLSFRSIKLSIQHEKIMAVTVKASLGKTKYYTEVIAGENQLITDEPVDKGGQNKGFNPFEILATSLASCTAATLRMYIDRKQWNVEKIDVEVELEIFPLTKLAVFKEILVLKETV